MAVVFRIVAARGPNRLQTASIQRKEIQDMNTPAVDASHGRLKMDLFARRFIETADRMKIAVTSPGMDRIVSLISSNSEYLVFIICIPFLKLQRNNHEIIGGRIPEY